MRFSFTLFIIFLAAIFSFAELPNGSTAPDFKLQDASGKTVQLSQFKGKLVVLEWVNFGCPFVKKHYNSGQMQKLQKTFTDKGVVWLSICSSAEGKQGYLKAGEVAPALAKRNAQPTAYLLDTDGKVGRVYDAKTTPHMFVIDKSGKLVYQGAIDDIRSVDVNDIPKAKNYVSAVLQDLLAGKEVKPAKTNPYGCSVKY